MSWAPRCFLECRTKRIGSGVCYRIARANEGRKSLPRIGVRDDDRTRNERGNLYGLSASGFLRECRGHPRAARLRRRVRPFGGGRLGDRPGMDGRREPLRHHRLPHHAQHARDGAPRSGVLAGTPRQRHRGASGAHCPQPQPSARAAEHHRLCEGGCPSSVISERVDECSATTGRYTLP